MYVPIYILHNIDRDLRMHIEDLNKEKLARKMGKLYGTILNYEQNLVSKPKVELRIKSCIATLIMSSSAICSRTRLVRFLAYR